MHVIIFGCFLSSEIHREMLPRPVSGYVPEEIWKKAGEPAVISYTPTYVFFYLCEDHCGQTPTVFNPNPAGPDAAPKIIHFKIDNKLLQ